MPVPPRPLRNTRYARELARAALPDPNGSGHESRIERLRIHDKGIEEIRFSWWTNGRMQSRPLDLPQHELLTLLAKGIEENVLKPTFADDLKALLLKP